MSDTVEANNVYLVYTLRTFFRLLVKSKGDKTEFVPMPSANPE